MKISTPTRIVWARWLLLEKREEGEIIIIARHSSVCMPTMAFEIYRECKEGEEWPMSLGLGRGLSCLQTIFYTFDIAC